MDANRKIPNALFGAVGLNDEDRETVQSLYALYEQKLIRNCLRDEYYAMHTRPMDLGISVPPNLRNLEQVVGWCYKAVECLANRSQFDGFVVEDDDKLQALQTLVIRCNLKRVYRMAVRSELKHSCSFLTVTAREDGTARIDAYPATASSALWSDNLGRVTAGMVVVDRDNTRIGQGKPTWVRVFTEDNIIELTSFNGQWFAEYRPHKMGRCLMEVLAYNATLDRPMGVSRISRAVMNITDSAMRASVRSEISAEFFTSPQKYLLGANDDALNGKSKWDAYIGNIFAVSTDKFGNTPQFGQLSQGTMQPHVDYMRSLATRFSGETNVPVSELGVVQDNPSSAEAIYASKEPLVIDAQNLNADNGEALVNVALMALAVQNGTDYHTELNARGNLQAKFKNPALPSLVSQADAVVKGASVFPFFAMSDVALEEFGFNDEQMQRLDEAKKHYEAMQMATARLSNATYKPVSTQEVDNGEYIETEA